MSKAPHMLAMAGMALVAGAAFGASPAAAAPAAPHTAASSAAVADQSPRGDRFAGYYRTRRACEGVGRAGEFIGRWEFHHCNPVWWGPRRGWWILTVDNRWHGGHDGWHHGGPGGHDGWHNGGPGGHDGWDHGGPGGHDGWDHGGPGGHDGFPHHDGGPHGPR